MAGAARGDALLLGITTPGYDLTCHAHSLYQQVLNATPGIYGRIFEADPAADLDDETAWRQANPCIDRPRFLEHLRFDRSVLPEHEFRRFRLGQWTATSQAWLPYGAWAACGDPTGPPPPGTRVWLGFDGSTSGDSTALVGATAAGYVFIAGCWENPGRPDWRVRGPRYTKRSTTRSRHGTSSRLLADPPYWRAEIADWAALWRDRVVEFPTHIRTRMAAACSTFYAGVMERTLTHDGDPRLARHVSNAIVKATPFGDYITKPDEKSPAKIDLAVGAVIAYSAAAVDRRPARAAVFVV